MYDFLTLLAVLGFGALIYKYFKDQAKFKARYKTLLENPRTIIGKPKSRRFDMDSFPIVGESFHQGNIRKIVEEDDEYAEIEFVHEPNNLHDENGMAIAVVSQHGTIGHLAQGSPEQKFIYDMLQNGDDYECEAEIYGGTKAKPSYGVWLSLAVSD